jgi:phosphoserine phosphatase
MLQLILVRPGVTDYDQQARIQGTLDIPLSDAGRKEATQTAEAIRRYAPKALYCSPCAAAEETADVIGTALDLKAKPVERLQNVNLGLWQGQLIDEVRHKQPKVYKQWQEHPEGVHPPDGEMLDSALKRTEEVLEKLARKHRQGAIVLVAPEPLATIIRHRLDGTKLGDLWRATNGCGHVDVLEVQPSLKRPESDAKTAGNSGTNGSAEGKKNGAPTIVYRGHIVERP